MSQPTVAGDALEPVAFLDQPEKVIRLTPLDRAVQTAFALTARVDVPERETTVAKPPTPRAVGRRLGVLRPEGRKQLPELISRVRVVTLLGQ